MRITLLAASVLALIASTATAQTTYVGPWQPRPTVGIAFGASDSHINNDRTNVLLSGTLEIPFSDEMRVRVEAGRSALRVDAPSMPELNRLTGGAHVSRLTISIAGLERPGYIVSGYGGLGVGFYRLTHDSVGTPIKAGFYAHGGAEVPMSNSCSLNFELGLHLIGRDFIRTKSGSGGKEADALIEAVLRVKVGL
jgi:hypothetical protein